MCTRVNQNSARGSTNSSKPEATRMPINGKMDGLKVVYSFTQWKLWGSETEKLHYTQQCESLPKITLNRRIHGPNRAYSVWCHLHELQKQALTSVV